MTNPTNSYFQMWRLLLLKRVKIRQEWAQTRCTMQRKGKLIRQQSGLISKGNVMRTRLAVSSSSVAHTVQAMLQWLGRLLTFMPMISSSQLPKFHGLTFQCEWLYKTWLLSKGYLIGYWCLWQKHIYLDPSSPSNEREIFLFPTYVLNSE